MSPHRPFPLPSREILEQLVENSQEGIWIIDQNAQTVFVNERMAALLDRTVDEFVGRPSSDFLEPADNEKFRNRLHRRSSGMREDYEVKLIKKDGITRIWAAVSATPLFDPDGNWIGAVGMIRDIDTTFEKSRYMASREEALSRVAGNLELAISERTHELTQSQAFLDSLIENLPNMVFVKDAKELRFVRFNKAGEELLGFPRSELIGKNDYDFFPKEQADYFTQKDRAVLAGREILDIPEEPIQTQHKGPRTLHTRKIPVLGKNGEPEYLLGISEDITEQKKLEQERLRAAAEHAAAEERDRSSREFLSIASHELKTPVTSLKIQLQMALRNLAISGTSPPPEKLQKVLATSVQQVDRLTRLIEDLLDVSRIQSGKISFHLESIDLSVMLTDVIERYREPLEAARCKLTLSLEKGVFAVADRGRMEQVIVNLIWNVLKYAPGAPLSVTLKKFNDFARVEVADSGPGIEVHQQKRIFERFGRAGSSRNISGLGLGLFISQQIVEAHGGAIRVESRPGQGAKFIIGLPLNLEHPAVKSSVVYASSPPQNAGGLRADHSSH